MHLRLEKSIGNFLWDFHITFGANAALPISFSPWFLFEEVFQFSPLNTTLTS